VCSGPVLIGRGLDQQKAEVGSWRLEVGKTTIAKDIPTKVKKPGLLQNKLLCSFEGIRSLII
jgi:hypothetical protein